MAERRLSTGKLQFYPARRRRSGGVGCTNMLRCNIKQVKYP